LNVLLFERDDHARTALEMVLALRGHHIELCPTHASLIEKLQRSLFEFVLYGLDMTSPELSDQLRQARSLLRPSSAMLIGIIDEKDVNGLAPEIMDHISQILVRPLDLDMLDLQFENLEQVARSRPLDDYSEPIPRVPLEALSQLAGRGMELGLFLDPKGQIQFSTAGIEQITGHDRRAFDGRSVLSIVHPDDRPGLLDLLDARSGESSIRVRIMGDGEHVTWFDVRLIRLATASNGQSMILVGQRTTTTRIRGNDDTKADSYEGELVAHVDRSGMILFRSAELAQLLGIGTAVDSAQFEEFIIQADRDALSTCLDSLPDFVGAQRRCHVRIVTPNNRWRTLELVCTNLIGVEGVDAIVVSADDVTKRKSIEQQLIRRAFLDPLTGMPNRAFFLNRLERALARSRDNGSSVAVLFLDLDRFKLINDSLGHEAGDQLLIAVGQRLKTAVRPGDIVARFGGDELIVLLEEIQHLDEATTVAERIIAGIRLPLVVGNHEISISTSVGIALSEANMDDANLLIRNADIALYQAKELGASRFTIFDESMAERVVKRLELENNLRHALENEELSIEFLPELSLQSGRLATLEVLTRWHQPDKGEIDPMLFMEVAEESGLIVRLGRWALIEACEHLQRWHLSHPDTDHVMVAINMSVREFQQPDIVEFVSSTLAKYEIPPSRLRLEIDERSLATDPDDTREKVEQLRALGISLAIDNFGRDFSSLSLFTRIAFDVLKVDRQFISGSERIVSNVAVVRAVTSLAHALGMRVCAEGIETRDQLAAIRAAGCDLGQGYLFSKSLDPEMTEALFLTFSMTEAA
jgi:diguanylate cyclase (GGDEF)-like protein